MTVAMIGLWVTALFVVQWEACVCEGREVVVVRLQADGQPTTESRLDTGITTLPSMTQVSICLRFRNFYGKNFIPIASLYGQNNDNELFIGANWEDGTLELQCCNGAVDMSVPLYVPLYVWHHVCLTLDLLGRSLHVALNNKLRNYTVEVDQSSVREGLGLKVAAGERFVVGQELDTLQGDFDITQSLDGEVADYRLYNVSLTWAEMLAFTLCRENLSSQITKEPLIDFHNGLLKVEGPSVVKNVNVNDICKATSDYQLLIPLKVSYKESVHTCLTLKGTPALPKNEEENKLLFDKFSQFGPVCNGGYSSLYWVGVVGNITSGQWVDPVSRESVSYHNFDDPSPTVNKWKICATVAHGLSEYKWWETPCEGNVFTCSLCNFTERPLLQMRGFCEDSLFDRKYYLNEYKNGRPKFDGEMDSRIGWTGTQWEIESRFHKGLLAVLVPETSDTYPLGLHTWNITGDKCRHNQVNLLLTVCSKGEYTCGDGTCISQQHKCDTTVECQDQTDELSCELIIMPEGYSEKLFPPRDNTDPLLLYFLINITSIRTFDLTTFAVAIDAIWHTKWHDSRLTFSNLQTSYQNNLVDDWQRLWHPDLVVSDGTKSLVEMAALQGDVYIIRNTNPMDDNDQRVVEDDTFSGSENTLMYQQQGTLKFRCNLDLQYYPFDTQHCSLLFSVQALSHSQGRLLKEGVGVVFEGERRLLEYKLEMENSSELMLDGSSVIKVEMELWNQYRYYIANAFLPSIMLVLISCLTFLFDIPDFQDRIMVTLTSMLVLASFFAQTSQTIPKTSYLKLIDVWYLVLICQVFCIITALVYVENLRLSQQNRGYNLVHPKLAPLNQAKPKAKPTQTQANRKVTDALRNPESVNRLLLIFFTSTVFITVVSFVVAGATAMTD